MPIPAIHWNGTGKHAAEIVTALRADGFIARFAPAGEGTPARLLVMDPTTGASSTVRAIHVVPDPSGD